MRLHSVSPHSNFPMAPAGQCLTLLTSAKCFFQQPPHRLRSRRLWIRLRFDPGGDGGVQLGRNPHGEDRVLACGGAARPSFWLIGY